MSSLPAYNLWKRILTPTPLSVVHPMEQIQAPPALNIAGARFLLLSHLMPEHSLQLQALTEQIVAKMSRQKEAAEGDRAAQWEVMMGLPGEIDELVQQERDFWRQVLEGFRFVFVDG